MLFEIAADESGGVCPFGLYHTGVERVDPYFFSAQLFSENAADRVDRALCGGIDRTSGRGQASDGRADIDHAAAIGAKAFHCLLCRQQQAEYIGIELAVEFVFRDLFERGELVDTGIIDQDVEPAEGLFRFGKESGYISSF